MDISVINPIGMAVNRSVRMLFKPFDIRKWFVLGFCAFLAYLGENGGGGGGGGGRDFSSERHGGGFRRDIQPAIDWVNANLMIVICGVATLIVIGVIIGAVLTWLSSRGKFMFLDGVVRNRGAVVEPWHRFRELANSLFWFRFAVQMIGFAVFLAVAAVALVIAWPDIQRWEFGPAAITGIVAGALLILPPTFILILIAVLLSDFVVQVMYLRGVRTLAAWGIFYREILTGHVGPIVLFYLMKILLAVAIGLMTCLATCLTCCLAALPYIGSVILLPVLVFHRSYPVYFLGQFGDEWKVFRDDLHLPA
jgi:hypothetical protein